MTAKLAAVAEDDTETALQRLSPEGRAIFIELLARAVLAAARADHEAATKNTETSKAHM